MNKKIYSMILALGLLAGCKKDPTPVAPTDRVSTSSFPTKLEELNSVSKPA